MLAALGVVVGAVVNLAIDRLAWHPRRRSPWGPRPEGAAARRWFDRVPIAGWLGMRRESSTHGALFWLRPMLLEVCCAVGLPLLYWWEIVHAALLPPVLPAPAVPMVLVILHQQYIAHVLLLMLMLTASMIDVDEKIIPDTITVPGTLAGLLLATLWPHSLPPAWVIPAEVSLDGGFWQLFVDAGGEWPILHAAAPNDWPAWLDGRPHGWSLAIALACWWAWSLALLPRRLHTRHGYCRAWALLLARLRRQPETYATLIGGLIGSVLILLVWLADGGGSGLLPVRAWQGLLTALSGLAAGGGIIWTVRIVGTATLRREAMGFGDVTLMAMIGTFVGWQSCLVIFFLAPVAGLIVGVIQLALSRGPEIPYGPFLCLATIVTLVAWSPIWDWGWPIFSMGWTLAAILAACMALMALMLGLWMTLRDALGI